MRLHRIGLAGVFALALAACASGPVEPAAGRAAVGGTVQLVPPAGAGEHAGPGAYGDRRLSDVRWVDYSTPGFAVVYLDAGTRPGGRVALAVEETRTGTRLAPRVEVVGVGGEIAIANRASHAAVVSIPAVGRVEQLAAGGEIALAVERAGPVEIFLLGSAEPVLVFASPGPFARPDADGRYALNDLPPGRATLRAWHPRLPAVSRQLELVAGEVASVDFALGVGRGGDHGAH